MKNFFLATILLISTTSFAQNKDCNLWINEPIDSMDVIRQTAEKYLETSFKMASNEGVKTIYEMKDNDNLSNIKVWMKQKRSVVGGTVTSTYVISSIKIIGSAERIQILLNALKEKVSTCATENTESSASFGNGRMFVEKQGGDWSKKNIPLSTLTITTK